MLGLLYKCVSAQMKRACPTGSPIIAFLMLIQSDRMMTVIMR